MSPLLVSNERTLGRFFSISHRPELRRGSFMSSAALHVDFSGSDMSVMLGNQKLRMYCLLVAQSNCLSVARQRIEYAHKITRAGPRYEWAKRKPHFPFLAISPNSASASPFHVKDSRD